MKKVSVREKDMVNVRMDRLYGWESLWQFCALSITAFVLLTNNTLVAQDVLKVVLSGNPPFIMEDSIDPSGISVDIWEELALSQQITFEYIWNSNVDEALKMVENESVDVLVGPVSITSERAERVRFSQPYFLSSLSIVSSKKNPSLWNRMRPFFSKAFFIALSVLLIVLTLVGALIWLAERHKNPEQFPSDPVRGIGNGIWFSVVTMTTVGFGDRAPVTRIGRIIAGAWMIIALITATSLVAGIASTLTIFGLSTSSIQGAGDLQGREVAVVGESPAAHFAEEYGAKIVEVRDLSEAFDQLNNDEVDAIIYDRPQLKYFMENHKSQTAELVMGIGEYLPQGYGFVTPMESPLSTPLNVNLLEMQEDGSIQDIVQKWLTSWKD